MIMVMNIKVDIIKVSEIFSPRPPGVFFWADELVYTNTTGTVLV